MTKTLLRGGCVLTLGAKTSNYATADVLIDADTVVEVGPGLRARDAEVMDASDTIVMPGFVDTHRHVSRALFRNLGERPPGPSPVTAPGFGDHYDVEDVYAATLIGLLGAVEAGITTVVDRFDAREDPGLTEAALRAHADSGLRTVFVYATRPGVSGHEGSHPMDLAVATRLREAAGPSTTLAFGSVVPTAGDPLGIALDWAQARELGLRIHAHGGLGMGEPGNLAAVAGILGTDVVLAHCARFDDADLDAIASSGACVSLAPSSEMAGGMGSPPIQQLIDRDIRPGLGVDDELVGPGDMFAQMRGTISVQHATVFDRKLAGKAGVPKLMTTRDVIRCATADGARVAGVGDVAGSLEPGKRADIVMLRTDRPNIFPINDAIGAVVWGMDTSNVDSVFASGRVVMRGGVLSADVGRARQLASTARDRVAAAAGIPVGASVGGER
ncbi:MAG TPA: amidohydrolase family protein [Actinomycetota bacterium]